MRSLEDRLIWGRGITGQNPHLDHRPRDSSTADDEQECDPEIGQNKKKLVFDLEDLTRRLTCARVDNGKNACDLRPATTEHGSYEILLLLYGDCNG